MFLRSIELPVGMSLWLRLPDGRFDKSLEQRMRAIRAAGEFGVELAAQHERMVGQFGDFHQALVGTEAAEAHSGSFKLLAEMVVKLETMTMAFANLLCLVSLPRLRTGGKVAGVFAQAHRSAQAGDVMLIRHQVNHRVFG